MGGEVARRRGITGGRGDFDRARGGAAGEAVGARDAMQAGMATNEPPGEPLTFTRSVARLAAAHTKLLAGVARREGLDADDAFDAVQDAFHTFLEMPDAAALAGDVEGARALLITLTRNVARNLRRRHHRARPHDEVEAIGLAGELPEADALLAAAEQHVLFEGCMQKLSEVQRHVVTLRMLEEMSGADVAEALALTPGHVAVLLHRAKAELSRCVAGLD